MKRIFVDAVIGSVKPRTGRWNIALAPDNTTWLAMYFDESCDGLAPEVGDKVRVTVPRVIRHER